MDASDNEYEVEEELVVVHLAGVIDPEYIRKCDQSNCRILGIDSDKPVLQLDQMCFQGTYEDSVGTNIILEEQVVGEQEGGKQMGGKQMTEFKYLCHTSKELDMVRIFFNPKENRKDKAIEKASSVPQPIYKDDMGDTAPMLNTEGTTEEEPTVGGTT